MLAFSAYNTLNNLVLAAIRAGDAMPPPTVLSLARKLLQMDTFQACSRQLAVAVDALSEALQPQHPAQAAPASTAEDSAADQGSASTTEPAASAATPSPGAAQLGAGDAIQWLCCALWCAVHVLRPLAAMAATAATASGEGQQPGPGHGPLAPYDEPSLEDQEESAGAMDDAELGRESCLGEQPWGEEYEDQASAPGHALGDRVEEWQPEPGQPGLQGGEQGYVASYGEDDRPPLEEGYDVDGQRSSGRDTGAADFDVDSDDDGAGGSAADAAREWAARRAHLEAALSGPCLRHLLLAAAVTALRAADGGPSHGLPPALLAALPVQLVAPPHDGNPHDTVQHRVVQHGGTQYGHTQALDPCVLKWLGWALEGQLPGGSGEDTARAETRGSAVAAQARTASPADVDAGAALRDSECASQDGAAAASLGGCSRSALRALGPCSLLLRAGRLALSSARATAMRPGRGGGASAQGQGPAAEAPREEEGPDGGAGVGHGAASRLRLLLPGAAAVPGLLRVIGAVLEILSRRLRHQCPGGGSGAAAAAAALEAETWRLAVGLAELATSCREAAQRLAAAAAAPSEDEDEAAAAHGPAGGMAAGEAAGEGLERLQDQIAGLLRFETRLQNQLSYGGFVLPSAPPAGVAAAVAGGLLPCLERLLRRAARDPQGPAALLAMRLLRQPAAGDGSGDGGGVGPYLGCLLAYGDPAAAAALVATMGKVLRQLELHLVDEVILVARSAGAGAAHDSCGSASAPSGADGGQAAAGNLALAVADAMYGVFVVANWLVAGSSAAAPVTAGVEHVFALPSETDATLAAAHPPSPERQLALLLSHAAAEWLPQLSALARLLLPDLLEVMDGPGAGADPWSLAWASAPQRLDGAPVARVVTSLLLPLLTWLPGLSHLAAAADAATAADGEGGSDDGSNGGDGAADSGEDGGGG
ncbi:hypothetical protein GPECTOR_35g947 [Gonium pectorale]|uniref:Uncharacterized protein n=1 Tax=Gonium pectorale TaxID=33097 RepID=A0A150GCE7_GONPE|nr:hypothetical protein GPECTOR_35g947 [Gonium pectorale]|eukprot:KXZ47509.1 hypothetical protein GPECTOR_35g947 [Gonium pectorale]